MKPDPRFIWFDTLMSYTPVFEKMQQFTQQRTLDTPDEIWFLEHQPVFTKGRSVGASPSHLWLTPVDLNDPLARGTLIPCVDSDRGGQITYHGPGQLIGYCLVDLRRLRAGPRWLVDQIQTSIVAYLESLSIQPHLQEGAPGVYVAGRKICSVGLRVKNGFTYHGFSLNVNMDLRPFSLIDPCGYRGLEMTQISDFVKRCPSQVAAELVIFLKNSLFNDSISQGGLILGKP